MPLELTLQALRTLDCVRRGLAPLQWDGRSTESVIYGERCAGKRLLNSWVAGEGRVRREAPNSGGIGVGAGGIGGPGALLGSGCASTQRTPWKGTVIVLMLDEDDPTFVEALARGTAACDDVEVCVLLYLKAPQMRNLARPLSTSGLPI